uniref:Secreted protein n=1 Tax=Heterorhabditis bacteriophora TaxID=37862 RepID=A0A1I7WF49_HETBA
MLFDTSFLKQTVSLRLSFTILCELLANTMRHINYYVRPHIVINFSFSALWSCATKQFRNN